MLVLWEDPYLSAEMWWRYIEAKRVKVKRRARWLLKNAFVEFTPRFRRLIEEVKR